MVKTKGHKKHRNHKMKHGKDYQEKPTHGKPLGRKDFAAAKTVKDKFIYDENFTDPTSLGNHFEGDINLNLSEALGNDYSLAPQMAKRKNAIRNPEGRWPNGVIPYVISEEYTEEERAVLANAMNEYHEKTCIKFVPRTDQEDYISIESQEGCHSMVGRTRGPQVVSLQRGSCVFTGVVIHEIMHATGFFHEQSRADRDEFVEVLWDNIEPRMQDNFQKHDLGMIDHLGAKYDLCSIMHYGLNLFAKVGIICVTFMPPIFLRPLD